MSPQAIPTMSAEEQAAWSAEHRVVAPRVLFNHGTIFGYGTMGCKCEPCLLRGRAAGRERLRRWRAKKRSEVVA